MTFHYGLFFVVKKWGCQIDIDPKNSKNMGKHSFLYYGQFVQLSQNRDQRDHQGINITSVNWKATFYLVVSGWLRIEPLLSMNIRIFCSLY